MSVPVSVILERKGADVVTIGPEELLSAAVAALTSHRIGALVVAGSDRSVLGVLSERDVVHCLSEQGPSCLDTPVTELMTTDVATCGKGTTTDELMTLMTNRRIRHVPVLGGGRLAGIVSIGDVVKSRLDELEVETETLQRYVTGSA
jgi:CBS domain-containing protein